MHLPGSGWFGRGVEGRWGGGFTKTEQAAKQGLRLVPDDQCADTMGRDGHHPGCLRCPCPSFLPNVVASSGVTLNPCPPSNTDIDSTPPPLAAHMNPGYDITRELGHSAEDGGTDGGYPGEPQDWHGYDEACRCAGSIREQGRLAGAPGRAGRAVRFRLGRAGGNV